jgi:hypothetical protein
MIIPWRPIFLAISVFYLCVVLPWLLNSETLPDRRPALPGAGPGSLVNLIDAEALFQKGQRDAWVMFDCWWFGQPLRR